MTYYVLGTMSGSSLDGLDLIHANISLNGGKWEFEINHTESITYTQDWKNKLKNAANLQGFDLIHLDREYAKWVAEQINTFVQKLDLVYNIHLIGHHGHTVFHAPDKGFTFQLGSGAEIAAITGYPTVTNLRDMDVALGGQGAPIIPMVEKHLFPGYAAYINLGGICNMSLVKKNEIQAYDLSFCNQLLNYFAEKKALEMDKGGALAADGEINQEALNALRAIPYLQEDGCKSLSNSALNTWLQHLEHLSIEDALATSVQHICETIIQNLSVHLDPRMEQRVLLSGGGTKNSFLVNTLQAAIKEQQENIEFIIPEEEIIDYKEALGMAFLAVLRWREEDTVEAINSGASRDSIGGALWLGSH